MRHHVSGWFGRSWRPKRRFRVWNITRDGIRERMAVSAHDAWDVAGPIPPPLPDKKFPPQETQFTLDGRWDVSDIEDEAFKEFRKKHGLAN